MTAPATLRGGGSESRPTVIERRGRSSVERLGARAFCPVPAASVAVARIVFGAMVAYSSVRFLAKGWVDSLYLAPEHHLTYRGFEWVRPLPAPWMHLVVAGGAVCGLAIAAGYRTRIAATLFVVGFAYCELIDAALYLNHYVYITFAGVLMAVLPVGAMWSLDARAGRVTASTHVPALVVWLLRAQIAVVYLAAGVAKLNADWLLDAVPLRLWLADNTDVPIVGPLLDEPWVAHGASWASAVFDLTIVGWLLWRRSRPLAYGVLVVFHLSTTMFQIGVFPWVMIVSSLIFFSPDWPRRFVRRSESPVASTMPWRGRRRVIAVAAGLWLLMQVAIPGRHFVIPGDVRWTDEGYYGSYRVMLTEKVGWVEFHVTDVATGETWTADPRLVLADWQVKQAAARPDLLLDTAHLVAGHYAERGRTVEVRADSWVTVNGRPRQRLVDPHIDLADVDRSDPASSYLLPFDPPVRR